MNKIKKERVILELIKSFCESIIEEDQIQIIEKIIVELYSCGFNSVNMYKIVNNSIDIFLGDLVKIKLSDNIDNIKERESIIALMHIVELSNLPN